MQLVRRAFSFQAAALCVLEPVVQPKAVKNCPLKMRCALTEIAVYCKEREVVRGTTGVCLRAKNFGLFDPVIFWGIFPSCSIPATCNTGLFQCSYITILYGLCEGITICLLQKYLVFVHFYYLL